MYCCYFIDSPVWLLSSVLTQTSITATAPPRNRLLPFWGNSPIITCSIICDFYPQSAEHDITIIAWTSVMLQTKLILRNKRSLRKPLKWEFSQFPILRKYTLKQICWSISIIQPSFAIVPTRIKLCEFSDLKEILFYFILFRGLVLVSTGSLPPTQGN